MRETQDPDQRSRSGTNPFKATATVVLCMPLHKTPLNHCSSLPRSCPVWKTVSSLFIRLPSISAPPLHRSCSVLPQWHRVARRARVIGSPDGLKSIIDCLLISSYTTDTFHSTFSLHRVPPLPPGLPDPVLSLRSWLQVPLVPFFFRPPSSPLSVRLVCF